MYVHKVGLFPISLLVCKFKPYRQTWYQKFLGTYPPLEIFTLLSLCQCMVLVGIQQISTRNDFEQICFMQSQRILPLFLDSLEYELKLIRIQLQIIQIHFLFFVLYYLLIYYVNCRFYLPTNFHFFSQQVFNNILNATSNILSVNTSIVVRSQRNFNSSAR